MKTLNEINFAHFADEMAGLQFCTERGVWFVDFSGGNIRFRGQQQLLPSRFDTGTGFVVRLTSPSIPKRSFNGFMKYCAEQYAWFEHISPPDGFNSMHIVIDTRHPDYLPL